jgi:hypothetical protein
VPGDDDAELLADIKARGMKNPVLVIENTDGTFRLVDGLRRLAAYGPKDRIEVVYTDNLKETYEVVTWYRDNWQRPHTARRIWDLHVATLPQFKVHGDTARLHSRGTGMGRRVENQTRHMMVNATGKSSHWIQCVLTIYGRDAGLIPEQEELMPLVHKLAADMDAGVNPYTCDRDLRKARVAKGPTITGASEQRQVLGQSARTANGLIKILNQVGAINGRIPVEEARLLAGEYRALRKATYDIYKKLMERVERT